MVSLVHGRQVVRLPSFFDPRFQGTVKTNDWKPRSALGHRDPVSFFTRGWLGTDEDFNTPVCFAYNSRAVGTKTRIRPSVWEHRTRPRVIYNHGPEILRGDRSRQPQAIGSRRIKPFTVV